MMSEIFTPLPLNIIRKYAYLGDRLTDSKYKNNVCVAVTNAKGKCIRGRNGNMLVSFEGTYVVVPARRLRRMA
jgi:hypothetical protein